MRRQKIFHPEFDPSLNDSSTKQLYDGVYNPNKNVLGNEQDVHVNEFIKKRGNFKTMAHSPADSGFIKLSASLKPIDDDSV